MRRHKRNRSKAVTKFLRLNPTTSSLKRGVRRETRYDSGGRPAWHWKKEWEAFARRLPGDRVVCVASSTAAPRRGCRNLETARVNPIHQVPSCFVLRFSSSGFAVYSNGTDCSFVFAHDDELPSADVAFDDLRAGGVLIPAEITLEGFADVDKDLELCAELTDDEIIHQVTEDSDDSDTENEEPAPTQPTSSELTRALMSLVYSGNMTLTEIEADIIAGKRTVQKKISDFFAPKC
ncbi:hypothetical protein HPB52_002163 [Rhipicephalus sanguineus]|uniref:Uncharacterized protein n=1 Tax=Rhipicephalus sanguineus TaxID=34632 RepID=A0A9D4T332_RHISA|nr:hypothetical protein HPB52_002163 [Rhipicephalus sanguineus]